MRKIVLAAAIAGAALSLAACSQETQDAAGETADNAMADAEANAEAAGDVVEGAAAEPHEYARLKAEMGQRVIDKISRIAPGFEQLILKHTTFTPKHMATMFGAPGGDWAQGLIHPDQMGAHRPGPRGWRDLEIGVDGLYLGGAGCHGGPGITFIPGYNAAQSVLGATAG